jgi:antitoxin (DNA-binding transcriptional repressor) of toxin-antitoxin stability system
MIHTGAARGHLSRVVEGVAAGEGILSAKVGKIPGRLLPFEPRSPGLEKGEIWTADHSDEPVLEENMVPFGGARP